MVMMVPSTGEGEEGSKFLWTVIGVPTFSQSSLKVDYIFRVRVGNMDYRGPSYPFRRSQLTLVFWGRVTTYDYVVDTSVLAVI